MLSVRKANRSNKLDQTVTLRFRGLQWRLAFSYLSTCIGVLLLSIGGWMLKSWFLPAASQWEDLWTAILMVLVAGILSAYQGLKIGSLLKKRILQLQEIAHSIVLEENLTSSLVPLTFFTESLDESGSQDEIQELKGSLQQMAIRYTQQVGSLQKLIHRNQELMTQSKQLAAVEERQKLARDLHDSVSQKLFAVTLSSGTLVKLIEKMEAMYSAEQPDAFKSLLQKLHEQSVSLEELCNQSQRDMRAFILNLRPVELEGKPFLEAFTDFLNEVQTRIPLNYKWKIGELGSIPSGIEDQLFRIVQEAISNAVRHAQATAIELDLRREGKYLLFELQDDGKGFHLSDQKTISYGLKTMKERTEELGGRFSITSAIGHGTRITVQIPLLLDETL